MKELLDRKKELADEIFLSKLNFSRTVRPEAEKELKQVERNIRVHERAYKFFKLIQTGKSLLNLVPSKIKWTVLVLGGFLVLGNLPNEFFSNKAEHTQTAPTAIVALDYDKDIKPTLKVEPAPAPAVATIDQEKAFQLAVGIQQPLAKNKATSPQLQETLDLLSAAGIQINQDLINTSKELGLKK